MSHWFAINGERHVWQGETISHEEICALAKQPEYASVTYSWREKGTDNHRSGITSKGRAITVDDGMHIDCVVTGSA